MSQVKQRVLTGTRPSGKPHLGNFFGAYHPAIQLQQEYGELFFFLADFHALNAPCSRDEMRANSHDIVATMLACGLDPSQGCFYTQSAVPEVCELAWILSCQTPYGLMLRAHSFKDAQAKGVEVNMGVFNYPILMAADILLFDTTHVPVGKDQKQHMEMSRDIAQRFNNFYGDTFVVPEALISESVGLVPGVDGEKMSKSKGNVIPIFGSDKEWKKAVMSIVTDSKDLHEKKDPDACYVYQLYRLVETDQQKVAEMAANYRNGDYGYGHAKLALLDSVKERYGPMRDQYNELMNDTSHLEDVIREGSVRARTLAVEKLGLVKDRVGVIGERERKKGSVKKGSVPFLDR